MDLYLEDLDKSLEDTSGNLKRKIENTEFPETVKFRIREEEPLILLEELREDLEENSRRYGNQSLGLYILRLAYVELQRRKKLEDLHSNIAQK